MSIATDYFYKTTGYDIGSFFDKVVSFINNDYRLIVDYYQGGALPSSSFSTLTNLLNDCKTIESQFEIKENVLSDLSQFELLDLFDEIQVKLLTIKQSGKWQRSSRNGVYSESIIQNMSLKQGQTLEDLTRNLGASNQDAWTSLAINNDFKEEDYSPLDSSKMLSVNLNNNNNSRINNIVSTMSVVEKNNVYYTEATGKDIDKSFDFVNNDFSIVEYTEALKQSFETILSTIRGSIPEFPLYGLPNEILGTTRNAIQYPIIFKSLLSMFQADSRWTNIELLDLKIKDTAIFIKVKATAIDNNIFIDNIEL